MFDDDVQESDCDHDDDDDDDVDFYCRKPIMPRNVRWEVAQHQEQKYDRIRKKSKHVTTQRKPSGKKEEWTEMLRKSPELGPILSQTEVLVNEALSVGG